MTAEGIIQQYIADIVKNNSMVILPSYKFEIDIVEYGKRKYNKFYTPSTYSRTFRMIRQYKLFKEEYEIIEEQYKNYKRFIVKRKG